jgi:Na+/H+-dicarboxylate symporter
VVFVSSWLCILSYVIIDFLQVNPIKFFKVAPAQLLAFSTSSSAATLPVTMECVTENVGVEVSSFVLPLVLR